MGGRGAKVRRHSDGQGHTNNNHTEYVEGGLDGDEDNEDNDVGGGHDNNDNDDDGCSGWDGHHQMRKGRGHDDRQKTQQSNRSQERRGKTVVTFPFLFISLLFLRGQAFHDFGWNRIKICFLSIPNMWGI